MQVLRMFHRKIHPENSIAAKELFMSEKSKIKSTCNSGGHANENLMHQGGDDTEIYKELMLKEEKQCHKDQMNLPNKLSSSNFSGKGEHWIKTDADCTYCFIYFFHCEILVPTNSDHSSCITPSIQ